MNAPKTEVFFADTFDEWKKTLPNVGRENLSGAVLEVDEINPKDNNGVFKLGATAMAQIEYPDLPDSRQFLRQLAVFDSRKTTGAHVHIGKGMPPRTLWAHSEGVTEFILANCGTTNSEAIEAYLDKITVASQEADYSGEVIPEENHYLHKKIHFTDPALLCFASGVDIEQGIAPAIHQVVPQTKRLDMATTSKIFFPHGILS